MSGIPLAFSMDPIVVPAENILPSRKIPEGLVGSRKFHQIRTSIEAVGLIEPLSVAPALSDSGHYLLLDGHIRFVVLKNLGHCEIPCLVAHDDEVYTYNNRINRLSSVQEHLM